MLAIVIVAAVATAKAKGITRRWHGSPVDGSQQLTHPPEYREAFALFDKKGTGQVPRESLGELLRSLGQNPTQAEVGTLQTNLGATCGSLAQIIGTS